MSASDELQGGTAYPSLELHAPTGEVTKVDLSSERATVGRLRGVNDIVLEPDPDRYVSGKWHCLIERDRIWRVVDNGSTNGTFLRRDDRVVEVRDPEPLTDGDVICILASLSESSEPSYWELVFRNPAQTFRAEARPGVARLEYDWVAARLFRISRVGREEIADLRPQVHHLLRYLLKRNRSNDDNAVLCTRDELMEAIWAGDPLHTPEELNGLIHELRRAVEIDPAQPQFVQTVRGLGFRLDPRPPGE